MASPVNRPDNPPEEQGLPSTIQAQVTTEHSWAQQPSWGCRCGSIQNKGAKCCTDCEEKKCEETALWPARSEMEGRRCSSHWSRDLHAQPTERTTAEETSTAQPMAEPTQGQGDAPWRMVAHGKGPCWTREKSMRHKGWQRGAVTDSPHYSAPAPHRNVVLFLKMQICFNWQ